MPEIRECFIHYTHAHHVLVKSLGLGKTLDNNWTLRALWAGATQGECNMKETGQRKRGTPASGITNLQIKGYADKIAANFTAVRGQKDNQTRIWPPPLCSTDGSEQYASLVLSSLVLEGIAYTPWSLILKFGELDPQVSSFLIKV